MHSLAFYFRGLLYLFLIYSLFTTAIRDWTSKRPRARLHLSIGLFFAIMLMLAVGYNVLGIQSMLISDMIDLLVTPALLIIVVNLWRVLIGAEREQVEIMEQRVNGNDYCLNNR